MPAGRWSGRTGPCTSTSTTTATTRASSPSPIRPAIEVNYTEAIQDNADFMGTILPDLQAGNPTGWDVISPGGWVIERLAPARLPRGARPRPAAELDGERGRLRQGPLVRPRQPLQPLVAGRHHRPRLRPGPHRPRDHDLRRPARPGVRPARGRLQRHARHVRPHAAVAGGRAGERDGRRRHPGPGQAARGERARPLPRLLRQRVLRRACGRRPRRLGGLVRRHRPDAAVRQPERPVRHPAGRRDALERQPRDPEGLDPHERRAPAAELLVRHRRPRRSSRSTSATSPA